MDNEPTTAQRRINAFISDCLRFDPQEATPSARMQEAIDAWSALHPYPVQLVTRRALGKFLREQGCERIKTGNANRIVWIGVAVR